MINLKSLFINNFMSIERANLDLEKAGLYFITGWNQKGQDSNGAGKSSILDAICFALFGRTVLGLGAADVHRWGTAHMTVQLNLAEGTDEYIIRRTEREVFFIRNNEYVPTKHKKDIQSAINETFNTNYDIFTSSTHFANRKDFLAEMTDSAKKRLFKPLFQLDRLDKAYDNVKAKLDECSTNLDNVNAHRASREAVLKEHKNSLGTLKDSESNWSEQVKATMAGLEKSRLAIVVDPRPDLSQRVDDLVDKIALLEEDIGNLGEQYVAWKDEITNLRFQASRDSDKLLEIGETLRNPQLVSGKCKLCGQKITKEAEGRHQKELIDEQVSIRHKLSNYTTRIEELDRLLLNYETKRDRVRQLNLTLATAKSDLALHKHYLEASQEKLADIDKKIEELKNGPCPYTELILKTTELISKAEEDIRKARESATTLSERHDALSLLKFVFGKEGLSSYIIERAFGRLESLGNKYLSSISVEGLQLEIRPQRELKSKALKEEIDIVVMSGNHRIPYWGLSGGQRQRINIALLLAVYRLCRDLGCNNFNFLLLDEVLDLSLADKGQSDTLNLLKTLLSTEVKSVFVISHRPEIASQFDFQIEARRDEKGITTISS